ncbi:hypothetical protein BABINDRAFT_34347 [Babjeviella inositovora NRRL Y-12698]|uniref:Amino acid transporter transmembrane domain-containing protein n=1 Tax=Babjeviella inositovora NRRL Y-12698 TaxID=984486 RepID=A0A1E3QUE3_9ASCO|nr:uncharacterized protein BABINDRAFT_34347 [Babjeviella inositovora NRRL Y-12698]ODQ81308.1 hypothetical protein BABINDRAFT_34347 [Babjeviella inositovora NRRL Y-12698]
MDSATPPTGAYTEIPVERTAQLIRVRRDLILNQPIGSFKGPNTLGRFALSYSRAQSFRSIDPSYATRRSFFVEDDDEIFDPNTLAPATRGARLSTLIHDFRRPYGAVESDEEDSDSVFDDTRSFASFRNTYSTAAQGRLHPARSHISLVESTPLVLKHVEDAEGKVHTVIAGQSTKPQTVFNSVNVLIGVGLLALPLGMRYTGWAMGGFILTVCCAVTFWSAGLLGYCMDTDQTLMTYADLGYASFGSRGRLLISFLFSLDLLGSCVALIILFSDSLNALFPQFSVTQWKLIGFVVLTPFSFLPLNVLSIFSLLGITCTISVVVLTFFCGLFKPETPGSLVEFAPLNMWPDTGLDFLLGVAILMAPFGGHAIFPNLKADMRHPHKFQSSLKITYGITYVTDFSMAVIGYLMFGTKVGNEVTNSLLLTGGYPAYIYYLISGLVSMVPFAKLPLNVNPIVNVLEVVLGCDKTAVREQQASQKVSGLGLPLWCNVLLLNALVVTVNLLVVLIAIVMPDFDRVIGLMGASLCFLICLILPTCFYLRLCGDKIGGAERVCCYVCIGVSVVLGVTCTYATLRN